MAQSWINSRALAYAMTSVGASMMNSVFSFYYVKIFLDQYHVSENWFHFSQTIFMLWNAINDPLFGYIQDNFSYSWVKIRRHSIMYGAPFYALAFLVPWFPWGDYSDGNNSLLCGVHLLVSLCFYDTLLTFVLLAQCSLFTELSSKQEDRIQLVRYAQIGSLIGSTSVFFCNFFSSNLKNIVNFQLTCIVIAVIAWLCMRYTGLHAHTEYDLNKIPSTQEISAVTPNKDEDIQQNGESEGMAWSAWKQALQIFTQRSFLSFVLMNFCQIYHLTFLSNFTNIIFESLTGDDYLTADMKSLMYGAANFLPQLFVILCTPCVGSIGYFNIIRGAFVFKILLGVWLYVMGPLPAALVFFFLVDSATVSATFSLFNLPLSDIIDEDKRKFQRKHPLSSMVFGTNALVTKPAQSLAPMITVAFLSRHGYQSKQDGVVAVAMGAGVEDELHSAMFSLLVFTPVIIGALELLIWSRYTIRKSHRTVTEYVDSC